ncbi:MAG: hypothetical protein QME81_12365 [bacterium]|nr:hypothetical protein [bacterium]
MGARWGTGKPLIPILAPNVEPNRLQGPLSDINGLRCDRRAQIYQFVQDLGQQVGVAPESPAAYDSHIERILRLEEVASDHHTREPEAEPEDSGPSKEMWDSLFSKLWDGRKTFGEQLIKQVESVRSAALSDSRKVTRLEMLFKTELAEVTRSLNEKNEGQDEKSPVAGIGLALINRAVRAKKQAIEASLAVLVSRENFETLDEMFDEIEEAIRSFTAEE